MSELVNVEDHGRVRHLILDRPEKRNAFNRALVMALRDAAREAANDHDVHCVVLRGEGAAFSAGIDIFELGGLAGTENLRPFRRDCIEAANLLDVVVVDLGKDDLLADAERVVAAPVE